MSTRSLILLGGVDTGKSNFVGRLWIELSRGDCTLKMHGMPDDIEYVETTVAHLLEGKFAPRTDTSVPPEKLSLSIPISLTDSDGSSGLGYVIVPDISGEVWDRAVATNELSAHLMTQLESAAGALLFIRVLSKSTVQPLDWVTSSRFMSGYADAENHNKMPTQVKLCELLRFLELKLNHDSGVKPRVAVIVAAWDCLDPTSAREGPLAYLKEQFPLFAARIVDVSSLDIEVFAATIFGGDPQHDDAFKAGLLDSDVKAHGKVWIDRKGVPTEVRDFTWPVAWALGLESRD